MQSSLKSGTVLGGRWSIQGLLGEGACAQVYNVVPINGTAEYEMVAKVIPLAQGKSKKDKTQERICNTLNYEYMMYNGLLSTFPYRARTPDKFYGNDSEHMVRYLVMERMEKDLMALSLQKPSPQEIATLGIQILEGLEWIHQQNFLFIDVKPDNFMMKGDRLYFVDFGLVERMVPPTAAGKTPPRGFAGTPTFCSVFAHSGGLLTWHDDIEAMAYVLWSLTSDGKLPWSSASSEAELIRMKKEWDYKDSCVSNEIDAVADIITAMREADRSSRPQYIFLKEMLVSMRDRKVTKKKSVAKGTMRGDSKKARCTSTPTEMKRKEVIKNSEDVLDLASSDNDNAPTASDQSSGEKENKRLRAARTTKNRDRTDIFCKVGTTDATQSIKPSTAKLTKTRGTKASLAKQAHGEETCLASAAPTPQLHMEESHLFTGPFSIGYKVHESSKMKGSHPMHFYLTGVEGPELRTKITMAVDATGAAADGKGIAKRGGEIVFSVGRGDSCDYLLEHDTYLSENHFNLKINTRLSTLSVQDNGSTNGTKLNGSRLPIRRWVEVASGDEITVGLSSFRFHL